MWLRAPGQSTISLKGLPFSRHSRLRIAESWNLAVRNRHLRLEAAALRLKPRPKRKPLGFATPPVPVLVEKPLAKDPSAPLEWAVGSYVSYLAAECSHLPTPLELESVRSTTASSLALSFLPTDRFVRWLTAWLSTPARYAHFFVFPRTQLYLKVSKQRKRIIYHQVWFRFNKNRLILSLYTPAKVKTHFYVSVGIFMKHFKHKKSLRKSRSLKILMMRFLRKVLIALRLANIELCFRGVPFYLNLLLASLFRPIPHLIPDPLHEDIIDEASNPKRNLNVSSIIFTNPKPFGYLKPKKRGRVKRKIRRKLYRFNVVSD